MNARLLATGSAIVVALIVGFMAGRTSTSSRDPSMRVDSPEQMEIALRETFLESDPLVRSRDMDSLLSALDEENLSGAAKVFREFSTSAETLGVSEFFARWAEIDVEGLVQALRSWPNEKARAQGAGWVAYEYAMRDGIAKAITFYEGLSARLKLSTGYRLVEGALNSGDESGLVEWVAAYDEEGERSRLTQSIILKLLRERGTDGAIAFFDGVPPESTNQFKRQVFLVMLDKLVRHDANAAVAFRAEHAAEPYAENSMAQLAVAWTDVDPASALSWVESQEPGGERDRALEAVIERWATRDEASAIEWARAQAPSPMVDRLHRRFVGSTTIRDPDLAVELARGIGNDSMREATLRSFARYWFNRKPTETRAWLVEAGLSESAAAGLIEELSATRQRRLGDPDRTADPAS